MLRKCIWKLCSNIRTKRNTANKRTNYSNIKIRARSTQKKIQFNNNVAQTKLIKEAFCKIFYCKLLLLLLALLL